MEWNTKLRALAGLVWLWFGLSAAAHAQFLVIGADNKLWFVWDEPGFLNHERTGPMQGAYIAMGSGGQCIAVIPELDMVIAHKVDMDHYHGQVTPLQWNAILNLVLASSCEDNCPDPK